MTLKIDTPEQHALEVFQEFGTRGKWPEQVAKIMTRRLIDDGERKLYDARRGIYIRGESGNIPQDS